MAAAALPCLAQYDQNIHVEGKYVPEYIGHDRIGVFPRPVRFAMEKSQLDYSLQGVNADFTPNAVPIQATGWQSTRRPADHRGYVELGLGSWLESTLSAGYRIIDTRSSALGVRLQHNSTSLWRPDLSARSDQRQWRYDESVGVYGHHNFGEAGRLDAAVDYHLGNFNYYGYDSQYTTIADAGMAPDVKVPTQTLNDVAARIAWHSPYSADRIRWNVGAGVRYFGFRSWYLPLSSNLLATATGARETDVNLTAGIVFPTSQKSSLGIDLDADVLHYADKKWKSAAFAPADALAELDTYGNISLTPYYRFVKWRLNIQLGARLDLTFNAGPENDRYGLLHVAPAIKVDYDAGPVTLFLHALGGSRLNTLAADWQNDYYRSPDLANTTPVYTPLDAQLGAAFGPFSGFNIGFDVAFRASLGQYFGGFYMPYLNKVDPVLAFGLPAKTLDGRQLIYDIEPGAKSDIHGFSFGLETGYDSGRYFKITARARYQHQNGKAGYFNGYDRPEFTAAVMAESNPWSSLRLKLGYDLRALRMMPVEARYADATPLNSSLIVMYRLPNLSMLNFGASYDVTDNIGVWIQADNLLCRRQYYMPGLPEPGLRLAAGLSFIF